MLMLMHMHTHTHAHAQVGCVLFSLLHRRPPFVWDGESDELARLRILRATPLYDEGSTAEEARRRCLPRVIVSRGARACIGVLLHRDWQQRPSAEEALRDPWLLDAKAAASMGTSCASARDGSSRTTPMAPAFDVKWDS